MECLTQSVPSGRLDQNTFPDLDDFSSVLHCDHREKTGNSSITGMLLNLCESKSSPNILVGQQRWTHVSYDLLLSFLFFILPLFCIAFFLYLLPRKTIFLLLRTNTETVTHLKLWILLTEVIIQSSPEN